MTVKNSDHAYGWVSRLLHWGMALAIFAMFGLGIWMRSLDYYSPYYRSAPDLHKSVGLILLALLVARFVWRLVNKVPSDDHLSRWERLGSHVVHLAFYGLLLALMVSGYFISTADGRGIAIFGLVEVPSIVQQRGMEEIAGTIHEWLAWSVMGLAAFHAVAALKHHYLDKDVTLKRMLRG
nr:cytochrome b [uncultured Cohaesibacter sp.]